jgi:lipase chaperone LimK
MRTASRTPASDRRSDPWARAALGAALLVGLAGGARHFQRAPGEARAVTREVAAPVVAPVSARPAAHAPGVARAAVAVEPPAETLPASLHGTTEDGELRQDEDGELVIGPGVVRFFDYYFSATGEESGAVLRARIVVAIRRHLSSARAVGQALALLDTYVGYREASRKLDAGGELAARLDAVRRLRRERFGDLAPRLFGEEERAVVVAMEQRRILGDASLSADDRAQRLADAEARLPDAIRAARAEATRPLRERAEEEALRAAGAGDAEVQGYRVANDGAEAADRLAELDRRRAAWSARIEAFRAARAEIVRTEPDPDQQRLAVRQLLEASFTTLEQVRVDATDRIAAEAR